MDASDLVVGREQLTSVFGYWPSFHDAEVVWIHMDRGPAGEGYGPTVEAIIHAFEMTSEVGADGFYALRNHVLVHFRFHDVIELQIDGFNHQNALFGLSITDLRDGQLERIRFQVSLDSSFGVDALFQCHVIEILSVTRCDKNGLATGG